MTSDYLPRTADRILQAKLESAGAVLIEGAKWCGKTTTAKQAAKSSLDLASPRILKESAALADMDPCLLLNGGTPRLLDEWQVIPELWDAVRYTVDERGNLGQFILTGSAVPASTDDIIHTGTGRFARMRMRPMSLFESRDSDGSVRLEQLFSGAETITGTSDMTIERLAYLICRGGWPGALQMKPKRALEQARQYLDSVVTSDVSRVDGVKRNSSHVRRLMRSLARHQGTAVSAAMIQKDMKANEEDTVVLQTIYSYLDALKKIFVIEDMPAWNPNLRSKTAIRTNDTRYLTDPSIAAAALDIGPEDLIADLETFGLLFETLAVRDLRTYTEALGGTVSHYRDRNGLECDAVLRLKNGVYALAEIKLGGAKHIDAGAATLRKLSSLIDTEKTKAPAFLMVLVGIGSYAYRRPDGVYVVPVSCLRD